MMFEHHEHLSQYPIRFFISNQLYIEFLKMSFNNQILAKMSSNLEVTLEEGL
jgi:hypothetical protein